MAERHIDGRMMKTAPGYPKHKGLRGQGAFL